MTVTLSAALSQKFAQAFSKVLGKDLPEDFSPEIIRATNPQFGHYQCNSAMQLGALLKRQPRGLAEHVKAAFDGGSMVEKLEVAGPGFLNVTFHPQFLSEAIAHVASDERLGVPLAQKRERVIVDYSSPNIAKELHVGHLRSTIIGESLARLLEFLGHDVVRLSHIGDWGTQFGMLISHIEEKEPEVFKGDKDVPLSDLMLWYRESKKRFDDDPHFKLKAQQRVVMLQGGDEETRQAWERICEISRLAYREIYDLLDVQLQERGESFYNPYLGKIVDEFEKKKLVTVSEGAKCVFLDGFITPEGLPLPLILQKSDGGYNYETTDLAALRYRLEEDRADRILYVVDSGQSLHFKMVFKAAELVGFYDASRAQVEHVPFGLVLGTDGKRFRTRSGETERLIDLLQEAVIQARLAIETHLHELVEEEKERLAQVMGVGAVKYADLSCARIKDYQFSYERMLKFEGNTYPFLLYAYVRSAGIKRNAKTPLSVLIAANVVKLEHPTEIALVLHLLYFPEVLASISRDLFMHRLTEYLYTLAQHFHAFFRDCRVIGSPAEESRLVLCELLSRVLEKGLFLLGLKTVDRM